MLKYVESEELIRKRYLLVMNAHISNHWFFTAFLSSNAYFIYFAKLRRVLRLSDCKRYRILHIWSNIVHSFHVGFSEVCISSTNKKKMKLVFDGILITYLTKALRSFYSIVSISTCFYS